MVKLLKLIDNPNTVTITSATVQNYLAREDRLVSQRVENLLAQIAPVNNYRNQRLLRYKQSPAAFSLLRSQSLEQAEALLLRIYLHCPEHRGC